MWGAYAFYYPFSCFYITLVFPSGSSRWCTWFFPSPQQACEVTQAERTWQAHSHFFIKHGFLPEPHAHMEHCTLLGLLLLHDKIEDRWTRLSSSPHSVWQTCAFRRAEWSSCGLNCTKSRNKEREGCLWCFYVPVKFLLYSSVERKYANWQDITSQSNSLGTQRIQVWF